MAEEFNICKSQFFLIIGLLTPVIHGTGDDVLGESQSIRLGLVVMPSRQIHVVILVLCIQNHLDLHVMAARGVLGVDLMFQRAKGRVYTTQRGPEMRWTMYPWNMD